MLCSALFGAGVQFCVCACRSSELSSLDCFQHLSFFYCCFFFFQAEDGIRDLVRSRGLGDVYKRQDKGFALTCVGEVLHRWRDHERRATRVDLRYRHEACLLYTSDAADERSSVDLGGRRIIKKKKTTSDSRGRWHTTKAVHKV